MPLIANVKLGERKSIHSSLSAPVKGAQWTFSFFATLSKLTSFGPNFNHQTNGDIPSYIEMGDQSSNIKPYERTCVMRAGWFKACNFIPRAYRVKSRLRL